MNPLRIGTGSYEDSVSHRPKQNMHTTFHKGKQIPVKHLNSMDILNLGRCTIVIHAVFWKFEFPCETRLPGSMGDPIILNHNPYLLDISIENGTCDPNPLNLLKNHCKQLLGRISILACQCQAQAPTCTVRSA